MRRAYDTFLQVVVSADSAAKNGGSEAYRYECARCGEEVGLTAVDSEYMVPHFRHRSGNNNVECEEYLGQPIALRIDSTSLKTRNKQTEFYFDNTKKMFFLGLRFSEDEINAYENESAKFELRTSAHSQAFETLVINKINCIPDKPILIPITHFSYNYFLSNTLNETKYKCDFFKKDGFPIFFKILGNNLESEYRAKWIRSTTLYTGVSYLLVSESLFLSSQTCRFSNDIDISPEFSFDTMGKRFIGQFLTIKNKTPDIESLFSSWGYQVEASETLTLLWPPAIQTDENLVVSSNEIFLFSSFKLEPYRNTNVRSKHITKIEDNISKISINLSNPRVKIFQKNADVTIDRKKAHPISHKAIFLEKKYVRIFRVPDDGSYYLFNRSGVISVKEGMTVQLTPNSFIYRYNSGYLDGIIYLLQKEEVSGEQLLNDLLAHYKRAVSLSLEPFANLELSETATKYIEECIERGDVINAAAKRFIEEGRL